MTSAYNPESGTVTYGYDNSGNLTSKLDVPRNITTTFVYDALNRVTSKSYNDNPQTPPVSYFYDAQSLPSGAPSFDRGWATGRLVAVTYGGASAGTYRGYDQMGRVVRQYQRTDSVNYLVEATYWANSALKDETYPSVPGAGDRRMVSYFNDPAGRLGSLSSAATTYAPAASVSNIGYASHNALKTETYGNSLVHAMTYNNRLQPNEIKLGTSGNPASILGLTYNYGTTNNNGNVQSVSYAGGGLSYTQTFGYDQLNRLTTSVESGASWSQTNSYDRYGNRSIVGGGLSFNANNNRITTAGYSYDAVGNLTNDGAHAYTFDAENKISKVDSVSAYNYDGEGQRVRKLVGENLRFIYDMSGKEVAEFDGSTGALKKEYIYGASGLVATIEPTAVNANGTRYTTSDHLGSPRVITNSGAGVVSRHDYKPFGEELGSGIGGRTNGIGYGVADGLHQKFTSKERDNETGLDYFLARYYASTQGRFTSADNVGGQRPDPQSLNLYAYVLNNPLAHVDPTGHMAELPDPTANTLNQALCLKVGVGCNTEPMAQRGHGRPTEIKPKVPTAGSGAAAQEAVTVTAKRGLLRRIVGKAGRLLGLGGGPVALAAHILVEEMVNPQPVGGGDADLGPASMPWMNDEVQASFEGEVFNPHRLEHDTTFYRYFDPGHMIGPGVGFLSADLYSSSAEARASLALSPQVTKNTALMVVDVTVPAGTIVAQGRAGDQEPKSKYPGGGSQVVIGNPGGPGIRYGTPRRLPR